MPAAAQHQGEIAAQEAQGRAGGEEAVPLRPLRLEVEEEGAVLQDAVVVDPHRDEHQVAVAVEGIEGAQHVVEDAELRRAQAAVPGEPSFRIDRLWHSGGGRHVDVALEDPAVERIARAPPHEVGAGRADQGLERPDPRPLPHGVGEGRAVRGQVAHQDVVHVAAVVHQEDHGRAGGHGGEPRLVREAEPHAVEELRHPLREPVADPEIEVDVEGGDDLAGVALHPADQHLAGDPLLAGERVHRLDHRGVVDQAVDQHPPPGAVEGGDLQPQPGVQLVDDAVDPPPEIPADAGHQQPVERRPGGEQEQHDHQPEGEADQAGHKGSRGIIAGRRDPLPGISSISLSPISLLRQLLY